MADPVPLQGARLRRVARASLVVLPEQHGVLLTRHPEHPLVRGQLLVPGTSRPATGGPDRGAAARLVLTGSHLTGHEQPPVVLRYHPNPVDDRGIGGRSVRGSACTTRVSGHGTPECRGTYRSGARPAVPGLTQDQTTGGLACTRPSCRRADGGRTVWSLDVLRSEWRATLWSVS